MVHLFTKVMKNENEGSGSETIMKLLGDVMKDEDKHVRLSVVEALGNIESEAAVRLLINSLKDKDGDMQRKTADILKAICTVKNKKQLEELLNSVDFTGSSTLGKVVCVKSSFTAILTLKLGLIECLSCSFTIILVLLPIWICDYSKLSHFFNQVELLLISCISQKSLSWKKETMIKE